jgi:tetratricopeptide (TPR) repeat protein
MHIYGTDPDFKKIFPESQNENNPLICREVFISTHGNQPAVCTRHLNSYHDFGPPELYRLEFYQLQKGSLVLAQQGFTEGTHYNILMNRGALAFHSGQYLEALDFYNQAVSSSTGEISSRAFVESLFYLAESRKFLKDFKNALELYQKIVLEFSQNSFTDAAQSEIELISQNIEHPEALSFYIDVTSHINCDRWETALELLQNHELGSAESPLLDRMLFIRAEVLTALNRVDEAIEVYRTIQQKFPDSPIIGSVEAALEDMLEKPEETDGL